MDKTGPIVIIEDDPDDQMFLKAIFSELAIKNEIIFFNNGYSALGYFEEIVTPPFLILSDINMAMMDGLKLRQHVYQNKLFPLQYVPYVFMSTASSKSVIEAAYSTSIQGFFVKPTTFEELSRIVRNIITYWMDCKLPLYALY